MSIRAFRENLESGDSVRSIKALEQAALEEARATQVGLVRKGGLEPPRCYPQVPETCASTSSATFAGARKITRNYLGNQVFAVSLKTTLILRSGAPRGTLARKLEAKIARSRSTLRGEVHRRQAKDSPPPHNHLSG
jgi:hypothetical protein